MAEEKDLIEVDDTECIKYILNHIPSEFKPVITEDDVQYVLDLICDYYTEMNLLDDENDKEEESYIAEEEMFQYIRKIINKEKIITISDDALQAILDQEFNYGIEIGIYTEENTDEE